MGQVEHCAAVLIVPEQEAALDLCVSAKDLMQGY